MNNDGKYSEQTQNVPTKKPWYKKWWVIAIGIVVLIGIIGGSGEEKSNEPDTVQEKTAREMSDPAQVTDELNEPEEIQPEVTITSAKIAVEYSENEVAADAKYKNKMIEISGKVSSVDNGLLDDEMIVKLSDQKYDISNPWCYMQESEKDKVLNLKKGQQVILIGEGNSATMGSPILKECVIKE